jgi:hypothetical protein
MGLDKSWFEPFESFCGGRSRMLKEEKTDRVSVIKVSTRGLEAWITASGERLNRPGLAGRVSHGGRIRGRVSITLGEAMAPIYSNSWSRISNLPCSLAPDEQVFYLSPPVKIHSNSATRRPRTFSNIAFPHGGIDTLACSTTELWRHVWLEGMRVVCSFAAI